MKWSKRLSRYTLPGMGLNWDASYFGLLFLAMVLVVLYTFLHDYQAALRALYVYRYGTQILRQGAVMPTLNTLLRHKFTVFWAYTALCALRAFANYRSFFTETKSIYLMKRLKDKNELSRRCLAIPAAACGAALGCWYLLQDPGTGPSLGRLAAFALLISLLTSLSGLIFVPLLLGAVWLKYKVGRMDGEAWEHYFQSVSTVGLLLRGGVLLLLALGLTALLSWPLFALLGFPMPERLALLFFLIGGADLFRKLSQERDELVRKLLRLKLPGGRKGVTEQ